MWIAIASRCRPTAKEFINALFEVMAAQAHTTQSNRKAIMIIGSNARIQCAILSVYQNIISSVELPNRIHRCSSIDWPTRWWSVRLCQPSVDSICTWMRQTRTLPFIVASFRRVYSRECSTSSKLKWCTWCLLHWSRHWRCCECTNHLRPRHEQIQLFNKRTVIIIIILWDFISHHLCVGLLGLFHSWFRVRCEYCGVFQFASPSVLCTLDSSFNVNWHL